MSTRGIGWGEATGARFGRLLDSCLGAPRIDLRPDAAVIAVASGKGGTGKSFVAASIAVLLARLGRRVTVVDCDFGLATTHLLLNVQPHGTLQHVLEGRHGARDVVQVSPFGPRLVPGATGVQQMASLARPALERLGAALGEWARDADVLLLDVGAGLSAPGLLTLAAADHVLLVTQPELAALTDAYAVVKCLCTAAGEVPTFAAVLNRVRTPGQGEASFQKLADVSRRFLDVRLHYLGEIAEEPAVALRRLGQPPLVIGHPSCRTSIQIQTVLARLGDVFGPLAPRTPRGGMDVTRRFRQRLTGTR